MTKEYENTLKNIVESKQKRARRFRKIQLTNAIEYELHGAVNLLLIYMAAQAHHWFAWVLSGLFVVMNILLIKIDMDMDFHRYRNEAELQHLEGVLAYSASLLDKAERKETSNGKRQKKAEKGK